jgi:acyl carrier protein
MNRSSEIAQEVRAFIVSNFLYGRGRPFTNEASLMGEGIVDSTGVLELVAFLQQTYNITVEDDELRLENLDTVDNVTEYVSRKLGLVAEPTADELQENVAGGRL